MGAGGRTLSQGAIKVDYRHDDSDFKASIELPEGVTAQVSMPVDRGQGSIEVDGRTVLGAPAEDGTRLTVPLSTPGLHELHSHLST